MIDNLTLLLTHSLILIACWRLLSRRDLDTENPAKPEGFIAAIRRRQQSPGDASDA